MLAHAPAAYRGGLRRKMGEEGGVSTNESGFRSWATSFAAKDLKGNGLRRGDGRGGGTAGATEYGNVCGW